MDRRSLTPRSVVGFVALMLACTRKPCDEDELARVAEALALRSPAARDAALDSLARACPKLPPGLVRSLDLMFAYEPEIHPIDADFDDPAYVELRRATCPCSEPAWREATDSPDPAAVFELCELSRYGLVADGEPFIFEDLYVYVLYEWLRSHGVADSRSRPIARALLSASASPDELMSLCRERGTACRLAYSQWGVHLPYTAHPDQRGGRLARVLLTSDALRVELQGVLELQDGVPAPGSFWGHVSPELRRALDSAAAREEEPGVRLQLAADATLEFGLVADVLFTAVDAGYREFELLVSSGDGVGMLAVAPASAWLAPDPDPTAADEGPRLDVTVSLNAIELSLGDRRAHIAATSDCTRDSSDCLDRETLVRTFSTWGAQRPTNGVVHVHVDRNVPYQVLVSLLPLARGEQCNGPRFDDDPNCWFWLPSIDSNPPLYRNIGATIVLGEPELRRFERPGQRHAPTPESTLDTFVRHREAIRSCLIADRTFMRGARANAAIHLMWGPKPPHGEPAFVVSAGRFDDLNTCIAREFDAVPLVWNTGGVIGAHWLELTIPYQLVAPVE